MKKIGIMTFHRAYSYGAKLQAWALIEYLRNIGFEAEAIDYGSIGEEKLRRIGVRSLKDFIVTSLCYICSSISEPRRTRRFMEFLTMIPHSDKRYDRSTISEAEEEYDYIITGSDQVWNPRYNEGDMSYLLDFVHDDSKKYSYAASFGASHFDREIINKYKPLLQSFNKILVREREGQLLLKEFMNKESSVVLDPTFLIEPDVWNKLSVYPLKKTRKYILSFQIIDRDPSFDRMLEHLHTLTGYEIIEIRDSFRYKPSRWGAFTEAGPREFLGLIKNAEVVVTNSFHATVFSLLFNRPFFTLRNKFGFNSRMEDLTSKSGLSERMFDENSALPTNDEIAIDYREPNARLSTLISETKKIISDTFAL